MMTSQALGTVFENRVAEEFRRLGFEVWQDLYAPTKTGYTQIDLVALRPGQLWVVECKNWGGVLDITTWTRYHNHTKQQVFDFQRQNHWHGQVVYDAVDIPYYSRIIVNDGLQFKDGISMVEVLHLRELEKAVTSSKVRMVIPPKQMMQARAVFDSWAAADEETRRKHRLRLQDKYNPPEVVILT